MGIPRVVITGLGIASPLGFTIKDFWTSCLRGPKQRSKSPLEGYSWFPLEKKYDTYTLAIHAAKRALKDENDKKMGIFVGGPAYPLPNLVKDNHRLLGAHPTPSAILKGTMAEYLARRFLVEGPIQQLCSGCSSGTIALGKAFISIQQGECQKALVGAVDSVSDSFGYISAVFKQGEGLVKNTDPYCPFDEKAGGIALAEAAAGFLLVEELEQAKKNKRTIIAELIGFKEGFTSNVILAGDPMKDSLLKTLSQLVKNSGYELDDLSYINAHGTGIPSNDKLESSILHYLFGDKPTVNASKGLMGHSLCACGAIEAIVLALSIKEQLVHACPLLTQTISPVNFAKETRSMEIALALSYSFSISGQRAAILMKPYQD